jgi:hypothetical protein
MVKYSLWVGKNKQVTDILWSQEMRAKKFLLYLLAAIIGGCIPVMSLHPLYTEEDVVFEEELTGIWVDDPKNPKTTWEFSRAGAEEKAYKLVYSDDEGKEGSFIVHLVKIENRLFLDVLPDQFPSEQQEWEKMEWGYNFFFFVPAHTFIKIDSIEPQLKMRRTINDEMKELFNEEPNAIKHELVEDKIILTASTKELQAFVVKYAYDIRVFPAKIILSRKKDKGTQESVEQGPNEPNEIKK